jgi:hypothetical protein
MPANPVFEKYKPLRNAVRRLSLVESLGVVRAYAQNLQFGTPIPTDCHVHSKYLADDTDWDKRRWIVEFHLEILCREIILEADGRGGGSKSLKEWKTLATQ